jgi:hypothetical protein
VCGTLYLGQPGQRGTELETLELKKRYSALYKASASRPALVDVPPLRFLMIDGVGGVGDPYFQDSMGALYALAYPVKFAAKKRLSLSYPVMPSEGLYWDPDGGPGTEPSSQNAAAWRLMLLLPDAVSAEFVDEIREKVRIKKQPPRLDDIRVQTFSEGRSVQILHVGPYADESPTVRLLFDFAEQQGHEIAGSHHEIYLNDPGKTAPDKLKTVLRYAVRKRS